MAFADIHYTVRARVCRVPGKFAPPGSRAPWPFQFCVEIEVFAMSGKTHKTHKGLRKRLKRTGTGKILRRASGKRHLMSTKSAKRARRLSTWRELSHGDRKAFERQFGKL